MFRVFLLGLMLIFTECKAFGPHGRIINGTKSDLQPWVAEIIIDVGPLYHYCGGSLIHPKWVLSAAHCFFEITPGNKPFFPLSFFRVMVGSTIQLKGEFFNIIKAEHLNYGWTELGITNDISLLELDTAVPSSVANPVQLPQKDNSYANQLGYAFGWGQTENNGESKDLLEGRVLITKNADCFIKAAAKDPKKVCSHPNATHSKACRGDSGGPLAVAVDENSKEFILVGVTSYGDFKCEYTHVYTRVSEFLDWISEHTAAVF